MVAMLRYADGRGAAQEKDAGDEFAAIRERFYVQPGVIYMDGNSLGLLSRDAEAAVHHVLNEWKTLGIDGWMGADPPWFFLGEELGRRMAPLVGAEPDEVVVAGGTTINLHALVATFYQPTGTRRKILINELDFPSDVYALEGQIALRGGEPERDLIKIRSRDGRTIDEDDIIAALDADIALVLMPSVLYRSGQLLDIERITREAHARGIVAGFDCAHSVGSVPHRFDEWDVDFAFWCNYKYLNAGPGSVGALYVNRKHFGRQPALPGWWGYDKTRQFDMSHEWQGAGTAGAWQISTLSMLSAAPLIGSLRIFEELGIAAVRQRSLELTDYLITLLKDSGMLEPPYNYAIGTPREHHRRGGHVAVEHEAGPQINAALKSRGVIPDFRPPNVVRLAPIALYTSFTDVWDTVQHLRDIIDTGDYRLQPSERSVVA
ncbi:MAG TPA: kynureninase [Thermomicrobiales bacterium]|nr:kynureninase [Thermomicrobiales bacterium]